VWGGATASPHLVNLSAAGAEQAFWCFAISGLEVDQRAGGGRLISGSSNGDRSLEVFLRKAC